MHNKKLIHIGNLTHNAEQYMGYKELRLTWQDYLQSMGFVGLLLESNRTGCFGHRVRLQLKGYK